MRELTITLLQSDLYWEEIDANLSAIEEKIWQIGRDTDVIVLPEMFTTGFTMNAQKLGEHMNMRTFKWMRQMADQTGALILGSFVAKVHDKFYNRLLWMEPGGNFKTYDKRHLFQLLRYCMDSVLLNLILTVKWSVIAVNHGWKQG